MNESILPTGRSSFFFKKKKNILIAIVLLLILLFAGGGYAMMMQNKGKSVNKEQATLETKDGSKPTTEKKGESLSDKLSLKGNIFDLMKRGDKLQCTFSNDMDGSKSSGIMYISGQKVRGDFNIEMENATVESHMITDGDTVYTWSSSMPQGVMMKLSEEDKAAATDLAADSKKEFSELQKDYNYDCSRWSEDSSKFEIPSNVTFTDMSETLNQLQKGGTSDMCSACNMITDAEGKAQCKAQLKCE